MGRGRKAFGDVEERGTSARDGHEQGLLGAETP